MRLLDEGSSSLSCTALPSKNFGCMPPVVSHQPLLSATSPPCRYSEMRLLDEGFQHAMMAGAHLGITNWLSRVKMDDRLKAAFDNAPPKCKAEELVGVFLHLESCAAWRGPQVGRARPGPA